MKDGGAAKEDATDHPEPGATRRPAPAAVAACVGILLAVLPGCGSRSSSASPAALDPIPECQEYERTFARCNGVEAGILAQPAAVPKTPAERDHLRALCTVNLERLKQACR